ncbi:MAG: FAD-dependent oxidoreductase [Chloroflexi bacterium]|nr:FAD-dependent oxidoreductase [Chloroflexota bacterium]
MTTQKCDAIIIGAGLGGLSSAAYLAKAGKKVLVLEHHTIPGGYAQEFRRDKYRFKAALHALDGVAPGGWLHSILSELEVFDRVNFTRLDPFYTAQFPKHKISVPADPFAYEEELIRQFPDQADGIRKLIDAMVKVYYDVRRLTMDTELGRRPPTTEMPARYPHILGAMTQNWGAYLGQYVSDPQAQAVINTLLAYYGLPSSTLNAATFIVPWVSYHFFCAFYPEGGSMTLSRALEATIKKYGGDVRYRQTVNRIEIQDGKAVAVETEKGLRVEADVIVSNANAPDTMLNFVGREYLSPEYVRKVESALERPAASSLVVYLGLERDLAAEGWTDHEFFTFNGYDDEASFDVIMKGRFEEADVGIAYYNHADPTCAPEGCSVVTLITLASWDYGNQWGTGGDLTNYSKNPQYLELKEDAGDKLIQVAEKHIPGLRDAIKYKEVATPLTNYRYTRNPGGSIYGSEQSVDNMYIKRLNAKTPISNLFMTGAWVFGGGMSAAMISGRGTARMALTYLDGDEAADTTENSGGASAAFQADGKTKKENGVQKMDTKKPDLSSLSCYDTIAGMPTVFNAEVAGDLVADIQFVVSGSDSPSLTIKTPPEVWLAVSRGEMDGQAAFMQQKYTVEGDFTLLMKLNDLFKAAS